MNNVIKKGLLVLSLVFLISCTDNKKDIEKEIESVEVIKVEKANFNRVEIENGILMYNGSGNDKKIDSINELLNIYTDNELNSVNELFLSNCNVTKIDSLEKVPNLISLAITDSKITKIENLDVLTNLINLNLSANEIEVIENLGSLTKLKQLDISDNPLKNLDGLLELRGMTHISTFSTTSKTNEYYSNEEFTILFNQVLENNKETLKLDNFNI